MNMQGNSVGGSRFPRTLSFIVMSSYKDEIFQKDIPT